MTGSSNTSDDKMANKARKWIARVKKNASQTKTELSEWEDEFLLSLDERLEKYGRAFSDPDKGAMNAPLSLLQGLKAVSYTHLDVYKRQASKPT